MRAPITKEQISHFRQRVCTVVETQFAEGGLDHVSMRSLARELKCSPTCLYSYFENKEEILAVTRTAALNRLSDQLEAALAQSEDPIEKSRLIGDAYVKFAFGEPHAYQLIFAVDQPDVERYPELVCALARSARTRLSYVETLVKNGLLVGDPTQLSYAFWAGLHGLIVLKMAGQLPEFDALRRTMMRLIARGAQAK